MDAFAWSAQQLAEFIAAVSTAEKETDAARAAVERVAGALDADVAAIVCGGELVAGVGYAGSGVPVDELERVRPGASGTSLDVPGVGASAAVAAGLEHPPGATLVVARPDALTREETGLLRGMARVTSMTMRMLRVLDDERNARQELERLAREQDALRRVATLVAKAASPDEVFSAVAEEVAQLWEADIAAVLRYEPGGQATIVGGWGDPGPHLPVGGRLTVAGESVSVSVLRTGMPARTVRLAGPPGSVPDAFRRAGVQVSIGSPIVVEGGLWGVVIVARARSEALPAEAEQRLAAFTELAATAIANAQARVELQGVAGEQAALQRVATLVARAAAPAEVFAAVAEEVGHVVAGADVSLVGRYDSGDTIEFTGGWSRDGDTSFVGRRVSLGGRNVATLVFEGSEPARVDHLADDAAPATAVARHWARSAAGAPINVEGRLWGVMTVGSLHPDGLPSGIEYRLADFTDLVATAIANTQAREELRAVADEQAALRRVALLVAEAAPPAAVFQAVAEEVGPLFAAEAVGVIRYDAHGVATSVGSYTMAQPSGPISKAPLGGQNVTTLVFETGRLARVDSYAADDSSSVTAVARKLGMRSAVGAPISVEGRLWGALEMAYSREAGLPVRLEERLAAFAELAATAIANAQAREELRAVADEQAALRRVATLVAEAATPAAVFAAVAEEAGRLLPADVTILGRYEADETVTVVAAWSAAGDPPVPAGRPARFDARQGMSARVKETGRPARADRYDEDARARQVGIRSTVAAPITVGGRLWGLMNVGSKGDEPLPPGTEQRLAAFTELVATAIANAQAQADLTASRARIVVTADETRRRIERDLHDGAQQRLVSLALQLRAAQATMPPELSPLAAELDGVTAGLTDALDELREFARGIHPVILTEGGLGPALKGLARRSAVPVELDMRPTGRLRDPVEVAAYYVVSEALTNAAKHANASSVAVSVGASGGALRISVHDDGVGGARFAHGTGLVGLKDRVEALGGRIWLESPPGIGTSLQVELPLDDHSTASD
jgi:signal transduction histidine kinase